MDHGGNPRMPNLDIICPLNETRASKHQTIRCSFFRDHRYSPQLPGSLYDAFILDRRLGNDYHEAVGILRVTRIGHHI
jgi:hypothetical protein